MVFNAGLADGSAAKTVRLTDGLPVATDGPYAEAKESLVGYWVLDVESEARILEIAGADRRLVTRCVEVRPACRSTAGGLTTDARIEDLLRELAPQVLGVLVRRYGQFDACEDAVQEALLAAATAVAERGRPGQPARPG